MASIALSRPTYNEVRRSLHYLHAVHKKTLTPQEFVQKWGITQAKLAALLGVSEPLVYKWFSKQAIEPQQKYLDRLTEIDFILEFAKLHQRMPDHLKKIFDE